MTSQILKFEGSTDIEVQGHQFETFMRSKYSSILKVKFKMIQKNSNKHSNFPDNFQLEVQSQGRQFQTLTFFGESAAECEYAANSGL